MLPEIVLAQGQHPGCYYYPPGQCPAPPALTATPVISEVPSLDGSYQVSISNGDPYSWAVWNTGQSGNSIGITGKATGTYTYNAKRCINTGSGTKCSTSWSPSATAYVLRTPALPNFTNTTASTCATTLTVNWAPGSGGYPTTSPTATKRYTLEESLDGGIVWSSSSVPTLPANSTAVSWGPRNVTELGDYRYRVKTRYQWNGYTSSWSNWTTAANFEMPQCPPAQPAAPILSQPNPDTGTNVSISWTAPLVAVGTIQSYRVEWRNATLNTGWTLFTSGDCAGSDTICTDSAAHTRGHTYEYRVQARKSTEAGSSPWSAAASITILFAQPSAPSTPTFSGVAPYGYTVNWSGGGNANTGSINYELWEKIGAATGSWTDKDSATSQGFTNKSPATIYEYKVRACNTNATPQCAESAANTITFPGTPGAITINNIGNFGRDYRLNWTAASGTVSTYRLERSADGGQNWTQLLDQNVLLLQVSNATAGTSYQYRVRAHNTTADGQYTSIFNYWVPQTPVNVGGSTNAATPSLTLTWNRYNSAHHYELQQSTDNGQNWGSIVSVNNPGSGNPAYSPASVTNGTSYTYRVRGCNTQNVCSPYANNVTLRVPYVIPGTPAAPTLNVNSGAGTLTANWSAVSGTVHYYRLERREQGQTPWNQVEDSTDLSFGPSGLDGGGKTYQFRVSACVNVDGCGTASAIASAYLPHAIPSLPNLSTGGFIGVIDNVPTYGAGHAGEYTVAWSSAGGTVSTLTAQEQEPGGSWQATSATALSCGSSDCSYNKPPNTSGAIKTYRYRVQACNSDNCSAWKEIAVQVNFYITPGIPASFTISQGPTTSGTYTLRWTRPAGSAELHYYYLDNSDTPTNPDYAAIPHDQNQAYFEKALTGGVSGQTYNYRVRACYLDDNGCDAYTAPLAVYIPYPAPNQPGAISHSNLNATTGSYTLNWSAASGQVSNYELQRQLSDGQWVAEATTTSASHAITGQPNSETRSYRVRACNVDACGNYTAAYAVYVPHLTPGVATDLVLQSLNASTQSLSLAWTAPGSGGVVQTYEMQQSTNGGSTWQTAGDTASPMLMLTALSNGTTYQFRVRACNVDACSAYTASVQVYLPYTAPGTPGALTHDADENNPVAGAFTMHWTAPTTIVSAVSPISHYRIDYSSNGGSTWQAAPTGGAIPGQINVTNPAPNAAASATLSGLATAASYSVRVRVCNVDACGGNTAAYQVYLPNPPPGAPVLAPTNPSTADYEARRFTVQWTAPASGTVHHYQLESDAGVINELQTWLSVAETPAVSYTFTDRAYGETYRYRVRACSEPQSAPAYCGAWATTADIRLKYPTPKQPAGVAVSGLDHATGNYTLSWNGVLGWAPSYHYQLQQSPAGGNSWAAPTGSTGEWLQLDQTGHQITGQLPGHYDYRVRACNPAPDSDCGAWSPSVEVTVLATPDTPASINVEAGACRFHVGWTPPPGTVEGTYRYELAYQVGNGDWQSLAWSSGTSHDMIVAAGDDYSNHTFRIRARVLNSGVYSPWSDWRTAAATMAMSCNSGSGGSPSIAAPRYNETGQYQVEMMAYNAGSDYSYRTHSSSTNGGGWIASLSGSYSIEGLYKIFTASYTASNAKSTGRYGYRFEFCMSSVQFGCAGYGAPMTTVDAYTVVLRDPGSIGQLTVTGNPPLIDSVYRLADRDFTLNWSAAPSPGLASQHYEVQYREVDADPLLPGVNGPWMILSQQTAVGLSGTLPESGIAYEYRARACYTFMDYINCGAWANLAAPLIQSVGKPRFAVNTYPADGELVIYDKRVPLQWLPPLGMAGAGALDHYQISLRSQELDGEGETFWVGPEELTNVAPVPGDNSDPPVQQASVDVEKGGQKEFLIRACGSDSPWSCGEALVFEITVVVPPDPPAEPSGLAGQVHPDLSSNDPFNGALTGQFSVLPSGASAYTLPIIVPPGTNGMQPELSLSYSSQAGNGIAGQGWSIGGLSAISRCNKTLAQDGEIRGIDYSSNDAYCLDGQRLINIGGNQYRTEINDFSRITQMSGGVCGTWFKVELQNGRRLEYGNTGDSCANAAKADGSQTVVSAWALNKVSDLSGNYMLYKYLEETATNGNAQAIDRIEYSGHEGSSALPYTAIEFQYDDARPDAASGYQAGVKFVQKRRLTGIVTGVSTANPSGYGTYALTYQSQATAWEPGKLESIEYCATVAGNEQCMAPLAFEWSPPEVGWVALPASNAPPLSFVSGSDDRGAQLLDLDNDGLPDLLYSSQNYGRTAYRNTGSGWQIWPAFNPPVDFFNSADKDLGVRFADIDDDGRPEMLTSIETGTYAGPFRVYRNTSSGWQESTSMALPASFARYKTLAFGFTELQPATDNGLRMADLNGDRLIDLVQGFGSTRLAWRNTGGSSPRWAPWGSYNSPAALTVARSSITLWPYNEPEGFEDNAYDTTGWLVDFNGDGLTDMLWKDIPHGHPGGTVEEIDYHAEINNGNGWFGDAHFATNAQFDYLQFPDAGTLFADFNGDGLPDLMRGNSQNDVIRFNTGDGWADAPFNETPRLLYLAGDRLAPASNNVQLVDVNADGRTDVLTDLEAWLATGTGWDEDHRYALPVAPGEGLSVEDRALARTRGLQLGDVNGDGQLDLLLGVSSDRKAWTLRTDRRQLVAVSDGLGNTTEIQYQALTDKRLNGRNHALYTPTGNNLQSSEREVHMPIQVVSQVIVNDGIGGELRMEYAYQGLISNIGRGPQGFESVTAYKPDDTVVTTRYAQRFPYTGLPLEVEISYGEGLGAELLESTVNEYCHAVTSQATAGFSANPEAPGFTSANADCGDYNDPARDNESVFVFVKRTTAIKNLLNDSVGSVAATITTVTDNTYGAYGYLTHSLATTTGDGHAYTTETSSICSNSQPDWCWRGLPQESTVTEHVDGLGDANSALHTAFEYYPGNGLLWKEKIEPGAGAPLELYKVHAYDQFGNAVEITACAENFGMCAADANVPNASSPGRSATTVYDARGRYPTAIINALDQAETREYQHPLGVQTKLIGPNGVETVWIYDSLGRKTSETSEFGTATASYLEADESGYVPGAKYCVQTDPPDGAPVRTYYDGKGRQRRFLGQNLHGEYVAADIEYDRFGRVSRESQPYFVYSTASSDAHWTVNHYDGLGRAAYVEVPVGDIDGDNADDGLVVTSSDYQGFSTITVDAKNRRALKEQNALGQTVRSVEDLDGENIAVEYGYDSQGNPVSTIVDGNTATAIALVHDKRGNKTSMDDPDMGHWDYQYNGYGELISQTDAKGQVTAMSYDKLGRMVKRVDDVAGTPQTSAWVYDTAPGAGIGKLHSECLIQGTADPEDCIDPGLSPESKKTYSYTDRGQLEETVYGINTHGFAQSFSVLQQYDAFGRVQLIHYPQVGGERQVVKNNYSPFGGLWYVQDIGDPLESGDDTVYWIAEMVDARSNIIQQTLRNQNIINNSTNAATGWLQKVESWDKDLNMIQQTRYAFDIAGNVLNRERFRPWIVHPDGSFEAGENEQVVESFTYDSLDRLLSATVTRDGGVESIKNNAYDRLGNFDHKDIAANQYTYNSCNAGPHAVCAANGTTFTYDANGNMIASTGMKPRSIEYSAFNKPELITEDASVVSFVYGADQARVFKQSVADGRVEVTWYVGLGAEGQPIYEQNAVISGGQIVKREHLNFIYAGSGQPFAVRVLQEEEDNNSGTPNLILYGGTEYYHRDHLGSVIAITGDSGAVEDTRLLSFDAWGKRRNFDWSEGSPAPDGNPADQYTREGMRGNLAYTGHEAVPEVGLIHMNGRVYDPEFGIFLSADPLIQAPHNSQSYNRYSYVMNNPIRYSDPSGYSWERLVEKTCHFFQKWAPVIMAAIVAYYTFGAVSGSYWALCTASGAVWGGIAAGAAAGFAFGVTSAYASGADLRHTLRAGFKGAVSGAMFGGIAGHYGNDWTWGRAFANGTAGGISAEMSGGNFNDGFKFSFALAVIRIGWEKMRAATDGLKLKACAIDPTQNCVPEPTGSGKLDTTGTRGVHPNAGQGKQSWFGKLFGMKKEGEELAGGGPLGTYKIGPYARFVNNTSKAHDFFNSIHYDWETGFFRPFESQISAEMFELYSFVGMPVAAAFTGAAQMASTPYYYELGQHYRND